MAVRLTKLAIKKGIKTCRVCKTTKPIGEFVLNLNNKWMPNDCLECEKKRQRGLYQMQHSASARERNIRNGYDRDDKPIACDECGSPDQICLDHCHITGLPRGWLCSKCNTIIGFADDDPNRLRALAEYIEKFYRSEAVLGLLKAEEEENMI